MARGLSGEAFERLLDHLHADRGQAGERYEELRRTLLAFFEWRGAPFPDEHADETLDRTARKIVEGQEIRNIRGYCYTVARLILLETLKGPGSRRTALDAVDIPAADRASSDRDKEVHSVCLDRCLDALSEENRLLIIEYYRDDTRGRIEGRRALAGRLGLRAEALANRAQRLRAKLERCVTMCLGDMDTVSRHY